MDGKFHLHAFPFQGDPSLLGLDTNEKVHAFSTAPLPMLRPLMPTLEEDFFHNPPLPWLP